MSLTGTHILTRLASLQERPDSLPHKASSEPADDVCVHVSHLWAMTAVIKVARKWGVSSDAPAHQVAFFIFYVVSASCMSFIRP
jgi:hypothetical protein